MRLQFKNIEQKLWTVLFFTVLLFSSNTIFGQLTISAENDTACYGGQGSLTIYASGSTNGYIYQCYLWEAPYTLVGQTSVTTVDSTVFSGLTPAEYLIRVTNGDETEVKSLFVNVIEAAELSAGTITVVSELTCSYSSDMELQANPTGGVEPYTYLWAGGNAAGQTTQIATGLDGSTSVYEVTINDHLGCGPYNATAIKNITFTVPTAITISDVTTTSTCEGTDNGTLSITASGGTGTLSYAIVEVANNDSTQQASNTFTGLGSGYYTPWAIDANLCRVSDSDVLVDSIPQPIAPEIAKDPTDDTVCAGQSLTITITTAGSGGSGSVADQYRYSTNGGSSWSSWSTTVPDFTAVTGTNLVQSRRTSSSLGCSTSASNEVSWIVVAQPVAPEIERSPDADTVCEGQTLTVNITTAGTGGAGSIADEYRYSTDGGSSWSTWGTSIPSFSAVTGTNLIQSRRTADGTGCSTSSSDEVSWIVVDQPTAPTLTRNPDDDVCAGTTISVDIVAGTGGAGTVQDEYRYSTNNGGSWSSWSTTVPSFASVTGTNIIQGRRTATGSNCSTSPINEVSWVVTDQPVAPVIARSPDADTVCSSQTLTINITTAGTGGAGTTTDQYRYSTNGGTTWTSWSTTTPSFTAVTGTNLVQSRRTATGTGCSTSSSNEVSWIVVDQPTAPTLTKDPGESDVCVGDVLTVTVTAGTGGTGTIEDQYRYSTDNGSNWTAWSTSIPSFAAVTGTNLIQSRRTATGSGCSTSAINEVSWTVEAQPVAPALTKSPTDAAVCEGTTLTATITAGTGGAGTTADQYRYSTDGGSSWSSWGAAIPNFTAVTGINLIQSRRTATGSGCSTSAINEISWIVAAQPVAPAIARDPDQDTVCEGQSLTVTITTAGTGGAGTTADEYRYSTDGGSNWSSWSTTVPTFAAVEGTNLIQSRRTADGTGCSTSSSNEVSWIVVAQPTAPTLTRNPDDDVCAGTTITVSVTAGTGGAGTVQDEYRYSTNNGSSWSSWSTTVPSFAAVTGTNIIQGRRTATASNCNTSSINEVSWTVTDQPVAPVIERSPDTDTVCSSQTLTINITTAGTGGAGTTADQYRYSTDGGSNWTAWSTSVPSFTAVTGTNMIQSRRTATGTGCSTSASNEVSWIVVDQPVAPGLTKDPNTTTVCEGDALTVSITAGTGGTGTVTDQYRYSTNNGSSWSAWSTTVPDFAAVTGTNLIQSRRTATGSGCSTSAINEVSWTVVAQPTAPTLTKSPTDAMVCEGQTLTVDTIPGTGGTGTTTDQYRYSTDNGSNWSTWSTAVPSFAAVTGTNLIQSRRTATGSGCSTSSINEVSWAVAAQPVAPVIARNPDMDSVCEGETLEITITTAGLGGAGTTADEYRYSTDGGSNWSAWSTTTPSFAAVTGTNLVQSRRTATGTGCSTSSSNEVSWVVVAQPTAPALTRNPDEDVCAGTTLTVSITAGTGGAGTIEDQYRYSTDNGGSWTAWSTTVPSFTAVTGTNIVQSRRTATGSNCSTSSVNEVSWTVYDLPVAPVIERNPDADTVCSTETLSINITTAGSGGAGTITDQYRYSTDGGSNWSTWSTSVPTFNAVIGTNLVQSRRTATGTGCTTSPSNEVSWIVVAQPTAPVITKDPTDGTVCEGDILTITATAGTGGAGTIEDQYRYSINNGSSWSSWSTTLPSFAAVTGTNLVESRRTATGAGCNTSDTNQVSWTVVAQPTAPTLTKSPTDAAVCEGQTLTVDTIPGTGGAGTTTDQYRYSTDGGSSWTSWSTTVPSFSAVIGTNLIESRRTSTGSGCSTSDTNQVSWSVVAQPVAPVIARNPDMDSVCEGQTLEITITTAGLGGAGTIADEYRYSTDNGTNWSSWSTSLPSFSAVEGINLVQSRRTADGTGCSTSSSNEVSWTVTAQPTAPTLTRDPDIDDVCAETILTVSVTAGTGGAGTIEDQYRYSTDNGSSWSSWSTTVPGFAAITGTNIIQSRRTATGSGCSTSSVNEVSWTVYDQPVAPVITRNQDVDTVCSDEYLTVIITTAGTGGAGTTADEYRATTDGGATWTAWSTTVPGFNAITGINIIQSRRTADGTGCTTSDTNEVKWVVVDQPVAPGLTKVPDESDVCVGEYLTVTTTPGTGGAGTTTDQYRYSTDGGSSWTSWSATVPNFAAVTGTNLIESRRTATATGCTTSSSNQVSWNVVAQPTAPTLTKNPTDGTVCEGEVLTVDTLPGTGGAGTTTDQFRYSTDNGTNWTAWSTTVPSFASVSGINLIQSRRTSSSTGCTTSDTNEVSWVVVAQPVAPIIARNPDTVVCEGESLSITITTAGLGGAGTTADEYRYSTDGGSSWTSWSTTVPTFTSVEGTNLVQSRRTADGTGCTTSDTNEVSWTVYAQPVAPVVTRDPDVDSVCAGTYLTVTVTAGTGGAGTIEDQYRYSIDNGSTWSAWSNTVPYFEAVTGINLIESRRIADGTGCTTSSSNQVSWTVIDLPVAPVIESNPNDTAVCEGTLLSITITTAGTGGAGAIEDQFRYSIDNGSTWSTWVDTIPEFAGVAGTNMVQSRRIADGTGCTTSDTNTVQWSVYALPTAPALTRDPDQDDVCQGDILTVIATAGTGGAGTVNDQYRYSIDSGMNWSAWTSTIPSFAAVVGTNIIESRRIADGTGCTTSDTNSVSWNVNQIPNANAGFDADACGLDNTMFAFTSIGDGTWTMASGPGAIVSWDPHSDTAYATVTVDTYGTYEFAWTENNNGCSDSDTVEVTFNQEPEAFAGLDGAICNDSSYTLSDADTSYASSVVWAASYGDGTFSPSEYDLNATYTPDQEVRDSGQVTLYLQANGSSACSLSPAIDSLVLTIAPELDVSIGAPMPFPISENTQIEIHVKTANGHFPNQDLGYYLIAPDGETSVVLKDSPNKEKSLSDAICNFGYDVDLTFTNQKALDDTLIICGGPWADGTIEDTVNATGAWDSIYGMNPAEGGWTIALYDYILVGTAQRGTVEDYYISFTDTNTSTGLLEEVIFEIEGDTITIQDGSGWPSYGTTKLQPTREIETSCFGECDAEAIANVTGGIQPYASYNWSPTPAGGNGTDTVQLCSGTYYLEVFDDIGCRGFDSVVVVDPPEIVIDTVYATDTVLCNGDTTGYIVVKASGGRGSLTYVLQPDSTVAASSDSGYFGNLPAGYYTVDIIDGSGCSNTTDVIHIAEPDSVDIELYISQPLDCAGDSIGEITAVGTGGTAPYTFYLRDKASTDTLDITTAADTAIFDSLARGTYEVIVYDVNGCTPKLDSIFVSEPNPLTFDGISALPILCYDSTTTIAVQAYGGVGPLTVQAIWNGDTTAAVTLVDSLATVTGHIGLNYIMLQDSAGCYIIESKYIKGPPSRLVIDSVTVENITGCYDSDNGKIEVYASGGWGGYVYSIDGLNYQSDSVFDTLAIDTYTIWIQDSLGMGCTIDTTITLTGPDSITVTVATTSAVGDAYGSAKITASGGTPPYEYWFSSIYVDDSSRTYGDVYEWDTLTSGLYYWAVRDANGCYKEGTAYVNEVNLEITFDYSCNTFYVSFDDGSSPYIILDTWASGGDTLATNKTSITWEAADTGYHTINIWDANNLTWDTSQVYVQYPTIDTVLITPKTCSQYGADTLPTHDGTATIESYGGTSPITYRLDVFNPSGEDVIGYKKSRNDNYFEGLGEYRWHSAVVIDDNGCWDSVPYIYVEPLLPKYLQVSGLPKSGDTTVCKYNNLTLEAGYGGYYEWVTDEDNPQYLSIDAHWEPDSIFTAYNDDPLHPTGTAYMIEDTSTIYLYQQLTGYDAEDQACLLIDSVEVSLYPYIDLDFTVEKNAGLTHDTASGIIYATEGVDIVFNVEGYVEDTNYYYAEYWEEETLPDSLVKGMKVAISSYTNNTPYQYSVIAGAEDVINYLVQLTRFGCSETDTIYIITRPEIVNDSIYNVFTPNGDGANDTWVFPYASYYSNAEIQIFNRWGQLVYRQTDYGTSTDHEWDGTSMKNGKPLPIGTYFYVINPNDGKTKPLTGTVVILR